MIDDACPRVRRLGGPAVDDLVELEDGLPVGERQREGDVLLHH
nr:hypothetical protein [Methylobacterium sp. B34]